MLLSIKESKISFSVDNVIEYELVTVKVDRARCDLQAL